MQTGRPSMGSLTPHPLSLQRLTRTRPGSPPVRADYSHQAGLTLPPDEDGPQSRWDLTQQFESGARTRDPSLSLSLEMNWTSSRQAPTVPSAKQETMQKAASLLSVSAAHLWSTDGPAPSLPPPLLLYGPLLLRFFFPERR